MKTRCDHCQGPFGLTRHNYLGYHFCKQACQFDWKAKRKKMIAEFKSWFEVSTSSHSHDPSLPGAKH